LHDPEFAKEVPGTGTRLQGTVKVRREVDDSSTRPDVSAGVSILNASGCLDALTAPGVAQTLDAFVTKTVTPLPREGNPPPRIAETDEWMLNSIGLQNPGIDAWIADGYPRLRELGVRLWVSVGGFSAADYALVCERLDQLDAVDTLELNLSCPNVDEAPETAAELTAAARAATRKPLFAKLSPQLSDVAEAARAVADAGADGLSLVNTLKALALDPATLRPRLARGSGGASGPALRPIALACVHACRNAVDLPIVGMGGIGSGRDGVDFLAAGATALALGTVLFSDPAAPGRVREELRAEAAARGYASAAEISEVARETRTSLI
jgi:dihydroorotate dehydrogenase (NAD+) catalytic subunit